MATLARIVAAAALAVPPVAISVAPTPAYAVEGQECSPERAVWVNQWMPHAYEQFDYAKIWSEAGTGKGTTIAVVDSGIAASNAHFRGALARGASLVRPSDGTSAAPTEDRWGHGTAVAGVIAARRVNGSTVIGMAPDATLMPVRVYVREASGDDEDVPDSDAPDARRIAEGIRTAAKAGADVINVSMSTTANLPEMRSAVAYAVDAKDAVVVASSGNRASEADKDGARYPAAYPGVIGVTASDLYGSVTDASIHGPQVDVVAPGMEVLSAYAPNGDCIFAGEAPYASYATAYVSAQAALLRREFPKATARQIGEHIMATAERDTRDDQNGWGTIRPYASLTALRLEKLPSERKATKTEAVVEAQAAYEDPLGSARRSLVWWGIGAGGLTAVALIVRPLLRRTSK